MIEIYLVFWTRGHYKLLRNFIHKDHLRDWQPMQSLVESNWQWCVGTTVVAACTRTRKKGILTAIDGFQVDFSLEIGLATC